MRPLYLSFLQLVALTLLNYFKALDYELKNSSEQNKLLFFVKHYEKIQNYKSRINDVNKILNLFDLAMYFYLF